MSDLAICCQISVGKITMGLSGLDAALRHQGTIVIEDVPAQGP